MAEGLQTQKTIFKCRKCRNTLFTDCVVINSHGDDIEFKDEDVSMFKCSSDEETVWYIKQDSLPEWLFKLIDEAAWIKGKIMCPKCFSRLGSFDFVNGNKCKCGQYVLPSIHIVKVKVDQQSEGSLAKAADMKRTGNPSNTLTLMNHSGTLPIKMQHLEKMYPSSPQNETFDKNKDDLVTKILSQDMEGDSEPEKTSEDSVKYSTTSSDVENETHFTSLSAKKIKKRPSVPVPDDIICPVCLEVYYEATSCHPCGHVFCDPCLRNLGKKKPTDTACPLCRQLIQKCLPESDTRKKIYKNFPELYKDRKAFEQTSQNQNLPLPWQHGVHFLRRNSDDESDSDQQNSFWNSLLFMFPDQTSNEGNLSASSLIVVISLVMVFIVTLIGAYVSIKFILEGFLELSTKDIQYIFLTSIQIITILIIKWYLRRYI